MIYTGMMPGELFALKKDMINWEERTITGCGLKTKERRERSIVLSASVLPVLRDLCDTSPSRNGFVLGMNKDKFYDLFSQMKKDLNIRQEVRPYSSRHSTATELELMGVSPSVIAQVLRHKNYATTAKHYIDISDEAALAAVDRIAKR
jgi:integrase